jgi:hypothetical protein
MSLVNKDVSSATIAFGSPAKERGAVTKVMDAQGNPVYPWFPNIKDRYPEEAAALWETYISARQGQLNPHRSDESPV